MPRASRKAQAGHSTTPQPPLGNPAEDRWLREQYAQMKPEHVAHLFDTGRIHSIYYDFERTDLNTTFSAATQFCGIMVTPDGRLMDSMEFDVQVPEHVVPSPQAAVITQTRPSAMYSEQGRDKQHIAAGKLLLTFRNPYRALWDKLVGQGRTIHLASGKEEEVRPYHITSPDGRKTMEFRLHRGGKYLSLRYPDKVDELCALIAQSEDQPALLQAAAKVLGASTGQWMDADTARLDVEKLETSVRGYKGSMEAFTAALKLQMGKDFSLDLDRLPKAERLKEGQLSYRDPGLHGKRWKRIASPAYTKGHNIRRYDDRAMWTDLHMAMSDEKFITHTKKYQRFRVDTLDAAKLVAVLDTDGANGFKPGQKIDPRSGKPHVAYSLSSLMEANTRDANPERGIDEGVRMPDGSKYDRNLAHQRARYDVLANIALDFYMRKRVPEAIRTLELNGEFEHIKPFLMGGEGFELHPVRAFVRDIYPNGANLHFGVCVGINEEIEERRQAVMIRTDTDQLLEDYTFSIKGERKKLVDLSVDELAAILKAEKRDKDGLFEILDLRKNPKVVEAELAFRRGLGGDREAHEVNRRFVLAHPELCERIKLAHSKAMEPIPDWRDVRNPQPEEHVFTELADAKRYEFAMNGKMVMVPEAVHNEFVKKLRRKRNIDTVLRRAVKPQTVEFEVREDTLDAFVERMLTIDKHLEKYFGKDAAPDHQHAWDEDLSDTEMDAIREGKARPFRMLPPPERPFIPKKYDMVDDPERPGKTKRVPHVMCHEECAELTANAVEYLWKLRAELMHEFHDCSNRYTVQDKYGHDVPFSGLVEMKEADLQSRLRTGEYTIAIEELDWSKHILAGIFHHAGRSQWLEAYWRDHGHDERAQDWKDVWAKGNLPAHKTLRYHGAPHEDLDLQRWMTAKKGLKEVARIEQNLRRGDIRAEEDAWGFWDIFMRNKEDSQRILSECKTLYQRMLKENPLTPQILERMGYDPETGLPVEHAPYQIPHGAKALTLDVPDGMLDQPLRHHHIAPQFVMLDLSDAQRDALAQVEENTQIFLRGAQSGRRFLAAKPVLIPQVQPSSYYQEIYGAARNHFVDGGMDAPKPERLMAMAMEALAPVPGKVDPSLQAIKMPWDHFIGTVSPTLGHRDAPLTGTILKDEGFVPRVGPARLQGMQPGAHKAGQEESGWEVPTRVVRVRSMAWKELRALPLTHADAVHYGYVGVSHMKDQLTRLFADQEIDVNRMENRLHLVDFEPVDKGTITWYHPAQRPMVRMIGTTEDMTPQAPAPTLPDPTRVLGAPEIIRGGRDIAGRGAA